MKKLILFYSYSETTKELAKILDELLDADLKEIEVEVPYSEDNKQFAIEVRHELKENSGREIKQLNINYNDYDSIYLGSPNWGGTLAPAVLTALEELKNFKGTVYPFFTHGGKGVQNMQEDTIKKLELADVKDPLVLYCRYILHYPGEAEKWIQTH